MSKKDKKPWSKKKKLTVAFSIIAAFLVLVIGAGVIALNWYCDPGEYTISSAADIINEDTNQNLSFKYNSTSAKYNNEKYTFKTPGKIVTNVNDKKKIVMLSATDVFKCLQYSY